MSEKWYDAGELCERHTEDTLDLLDPVPGEVLDEIQRRRDKASEKSE